ncbi:MAG: flocculation-associated PEP-CTERM protein PepA [Desulfurivibrionaceae bacterium]
MKRKIITVLACLSFLATPAFALNVQLDAGNEGYTGTDFDADTLTDPWDEASIRADTATTQFDDDGDGEVSVGDSFTDSGHAKWIGYNFLPGTDSDSEGLDDAGGYDVTVEWDNLTGYVDQISGENNTNHNTVYTGGSFDFYFDPTHDTDFGDTTRPSDDTGFDSGGGDEAHMMTISSLTGTGTNTFDADGDFQQGSSQFLGQITFLEEGYLQEYPSGLDLNNYISLNWLFSELNQNTQSGGIIQEDTGQENELFTVYSRHDGSMSFEVIPEPTTLLLFGTGLIGLAGFGRRKFFKKN